MKVNFMAPQSQFATKEFTWCEKENLFKLTKNYKGAELHMGYTKTVSSLKQFHEFLKGQEDNPVFFVHGEYLFPDNLMYMKRKSRGDEATLGWGNINIFCIDVDDFTGTIEDYIKGLPEEFQKSDYVYQYSSSYGMFGDTDKLKCHLFFCLDKGAPLEGIRLWAKNFNEIFGSKYIDPSVLQPTQPVYIQKRKVIGAPDPIEQTSGYVEKEGNLSYNFGLIKIDGKISAVNKSANQLNVASAVSEILKSDNYHEAANRLSMSYLNDMNPLKVQRTVEGLFLAIPEESRDTRWQERFDDIPRSISTGLDKMTDLPDEVEDILEWVRFTDIAEVRKDFPEKCSNLTPIGQVEVINELANFLGTGVSPIKKMIKIKQDEIVAKKLEWKRAEKTRKRKYDNVVELTMSVDTEVEVANQMIRVIADSKRIPEVFVMGGSLVSVRTAHPKSIRQCTGIDEFGDDYPEMPIISPYEKPYYDLLHRIKQDIVILNEKGQEVNPPNHVLGVVAKAENPVDEKVWKAITGIVEAPFFNNKWKMIKKQGYDETTGLYLSLHPKLCVKQIDPKEAWNYLAYEVFDEFPFESELDRAVAVSVLLTAVQRPAIASGDGIPGFGIVAPTQSSGKTTLAQLISSAAFNRPVGAASWSEDDEELGKHLLGILQEGQRCVLFDNIRQGATVQSGRLSNAMTNDIFTGRKLGENKTIEVPASCVWLFTGNGIKFVGDFATRIYPISLVPEEENPNERTFKREDINQWGMDNRKQIISAVLSIIYSGRGYGHSMGGCRFKSWDKFVRTPIIKVSSIDINDAVKKNQMDDPIKIARSNLFSQIYKVFDGREFTTKDMIDSAFNSFDGEGTSELGDALLELFDKRAQSTMSVGRFMSGLEKSVHGGYCLEKSLRNAGKTFWRLKTKVNNQN